MLPSTGWQHRGCIIPPVPTGATVEMEFWSSISTVATGRQQCRCIAPKAVHTVKKCPWGWANLSPETCRTDLKRLINEKVVASCWLFTSRRRSVWFYSRKKWRLFTLSQKNVLQKSVLENMWKNSSKDTITEKISDFHSSAAELSSVVCCYAVLADTTLAYCRGAIPSSSGSSSPGRMLNFLTVKTKVLPFFKRRLQGTNRYCATTLTEV